MHRFGRSQRLSFLRGAPARLPHGLFRGNIFRQYPLHIFHLRELMEEQMEGAPVRFRAVEDCEASGFSIPAGPYFGKEKIHETVDHPDGRAFHYSLDLADTGETLDVTPLVAIGKITVVRQSAL